MEQHFGDRLVRAIREKRAPCVVGLDTVIESIPEGLFGAPTTRKEKAEFLLAFNRMVIDTVADLVPALKPNAAFYERYGADGIAALEETIQYAQARNLLIILDGKRGDIGNTAEAYAKATLSREAFDLGQGAEALTVNPYLGVDSLEPFVSTAVSAGTGIFILVRTSNKGAGTFQDLVTDGEKLYLKVADVVRDLGSASVGQEGYSSIGAVVGATWPEDAALLRKRMPQTIFLVPGFGAQGGDIGTIRACFDSMGLGAIVNSSRAILYPKGATAANCRERIRESCESFVRDVRQAVGW